MSAIAQRRLLIHATNVTGLGARQVVESLLLGMATERKLTGAVILLPEDGLAIEQPLRDAGGEVFRWRRRLPNSISRFVECLVPRRDFTRYCRVLVLGDVPLPGVTGQVVFMHQPNLISPKVTGLPDSDGRYRVMRALFRRNLPGVDRIVVQTEPMREQLTMSYPESRGRVEVIPQPVPHWFTSRRSPRDPRLRGRLRLFYPAASYPHKNHSLLGRMDRIADHVSAEIVVTLTDAETAMLSSTPEWVCRVGRLSTADCLSTYDDVDGLFFPSLRESYGLPLVEAMTSGLPIVCADLPYARWLCGPEAVYFNPHDASDAWEAIGTLRRRLDAGWQPDWKPMLGMLPQSWGDVARRFATLLGDGGGGIGH
jgi:glycosyltransferase involved in cell wall biosynthesis